MYFLRRALKPLSAFLMPELLTGLPAYIILNDQLFGIYTFMTERIQRLSCFQMEI